MMPTVIWHGQRGEKQAQNQEVARHGPKTCGHSPLHVAMERSSRPWQQVALYETIRRTVPNTIQKRRSGEAFLGKFRAASISISAIQAAAAWQVAGKVTDYLAPLD